MDLHDFGSANVRRQPFITAIGANIEWMFRQEIGRHLNLLWWIHVHEFLRSLPWVMRRVPGHIEEKGICRLRRQLANHFNRAVRIHLTGMLLPFVTRTGVTGSVPSLLNIPEIVWGPMPAIFWV